MSLEGTTTSIVIIFGDTRNNGTMICCQVLPSCLVEVLIKTWSLLIIYGMDMYVHVVKALSVFFFFSHNMHR